MTINKVSKAKVANEGLTTGFGSVVMDMQESLLKVIEKNSDLQESIVLQMEIFRLLEIPLCLTEQVPEKLGSTLPKIKSKCSVESIFPKNTFSAFGCEQFCKWVKAKKLSHLIVSGIETPICIYQTCVDALRKNLNVTVVSDCTGARRVRDAEKVLSQLRSFGCCIIPLETITYSLIKDSSHEQFRHISKFIRERV